MSTPEIQNKNEEDSGGRREAGYEIPSTGQFTQK
jgi:hypothetical protein